MPRKPLKNCKIGVLMGGRSGEREISLRSGKNIFDSLKRQGFDVLKFDLDDDLIPKLKQAKIDIVYNILHGKYGEDGVVQGVLEMAGIPYTGSKVLSSALAMNKVASKRVWQTMGIITPNYHYIRAKHYKKDIDHILMNFPFPLIIKPVSEGSSLGIQIIKDKDELPGIVEKTLKEYNDVFVEEFIQGQEITVGVVGTKEIQALPVLELVPKNDFYDYEAKYTKGMTEFILPARLSGDLTKTVQGMAIKAHQALNCYGVSRVDMIVSKDHIPFVHEINTIPGMTDQSDLPAEAKHAGISFDELVLKILQSAY